MSAAPATVRKTAKPRANRASSHEAGIAAARLKRLRAALKETKADALLVTNPQDVGYLTPFHGEDSVLIVFPRKVILISDFRFEEDVEPAQAVAKVVMRRGPMTGAIADAIGADDVLGLQADHCTLAFRQTLAKLVGAKRLTNTSGLVAKLRQIKDDDEIKRIKHAIKIQQQSLEALRPTLHPGLTERHIAAALEFEMKSRGASAASFEIIAASGPNSSKPHARPSGVKTRRNAPLLIDWGAKAHGYCSDMTRVFTFGKWSRQMNEIYDIVQEAYHAGVEAVRPGATGREVDAAARRVIEDAGYGERFGHSLGHGLGIDVHESPRLAKSSQDVLRPGMVVTVEPGIYLPGVGGVRLEDDILVTDTGARNLSSLTMDKGWFTL
jgi:Xaa-Pro aminopeptidase